MKSRRRGLTSVVSIPIATCVYLVFAAPLPLRAAESCAGLKGRVIPAVAIGLPTTGAAVQSAMVVQGNERAPGEYCKVIGIITPVDSTAPNITFQVNLPASWNGKAVQYGGGGFNGTLVTGENPLR